MKEGKYKFIEISKGEIIFSNIATNYQIIAKYDNQTINVKSRFTLEELKEKFVILDHD